MKTKIFGTIVILAFLVALPLGASVLFPDDDPLGNGTFQGSKTCPGGGLLLSLGGVLDGATISVQHQPFRGSQGAEWIADPDCNPAALPAECKIMSGSGDLRLVVAGGTAPAIKAIGQCFQAVMVSEPGIGGGFATAIDADGDGNPEVFVSGTELHFDRDSDGVVDLEMGLGNGLLEQIRTPNASLILRVANSDIAIVSSAGLSSVNTTTSFPGPTLRRTALSKTNPSVVPLISSALTGMGRDTSTGDLSFTEDGIAGLTVSTSGVEVPGGLKLKFPVASAAPAGGTAGDSYYDDTNNTICVYTGAGFVQTDDYTTACN